MNDKEELRKKITDGLFDFIEDIVKLMEEQEKKAYNDGERLGFSKGIEAKYGKLTERLVPSRDYISNGAIKNAFHKAILGALKNYEDTHGKLIMPKRQNKRSLAKRIAGNVFNVHERIVHSSEKKEEE